MCDSNPYACINAGAPAREGGGVPEDRMSVAIEVEGLQVYDDMQEEEVSISMHPIHQLLLHQSRWRPQFCT